MHPLLNGLIEGINFSGSVRQDAAVLLNHHQHQETADHTFRVADQAVALARRFGADSGHAALAAWLHDISAVIPNEQRFAYAQQLGLEILNEEKLVPLLLHQKLSAEIARQVFNIHNKPVMEAIACHTTLRPDPTILDLILFSADKLTWDQSAPPSYVPNMQTALEDSLEHAAFCYQDYLLHSGKINTPHPWMLASHRQLAEKFG